MAFLCVLNIPHYFIYHDGVAVFETILRFLRICFELKYVKYFVSLFFVADAEQYHMASRAQNFFHCLTN